MDDEICTIFSTSPNSWRNESQTQDYIFDHFALLSGRFPLARTPRLCGSLTRGMVHGWPGLFLRWDSACALSVLSRRSSRAENADSVLQGRPPRSISSTQHASSWAHSYSFSDNGGQLPTLAATRITGYANIANCYHLSEGANGLAPVHIVSPKHVEGRDSMPAARAPHIPCQVVRRAHQNEVTGSKKRNFI
jgi:hypothetical protein